MRILLPINFKMKEKTLTHRCVEKRILKPSALEEEDLRNFTRSKVLEVLDQKAGLQLNLDSEVCRISLAKEITENLIYFKDVK